MAETAAPAAEFAKLMSSAAAEAGKDPDPAPYGYMKDPVTGEQRPRKRPGRAGKKAAPANSETNSAQVSDGELPDPHDHRDPAPAWRQEEKPEKKRLKIEDVPKQVVDDIAGLSGLVATPILSLLQQMDPYCGSILAQNFEPILDATLPIICRSEKIVKYFSEDKADWLLWGKLAMALAPVARAIAEHHVFHTVQVVRNPETGQVQVIRGPAGSTQGGNLQPPAQPEYNYAA